MTNYHHLAAARAAVANGEALTEEQIEALCEEMEGPWAFVPWMNGPCSDCNAYPGHRCHGRPPGLVHAARRRVLAAHRRHNGPFVRRGHRR